MKDSYSQAEMNYNDCTAPPIFAFFAWMYPATFLKVHTKFDNRLQANNHWIQCRDIFSKSTCFISETGDTTPTKIGMHVLDINLYLHKYFELIPIDWIFPWPWTIVHAPNSLHDNVTSMSHNPLWLHLVLPTSLNIFTSQWLYEYNYTDCASDNHCSINVY